MDYGKKLTAVAVVLILTVTGISVLASGYHSTPEIHTEVVGWDTFRNNIVSVSIDDMKKAGFEDGDYITVTMNDVVISKAIYTYSVDSIPFFNAFVWSNATYTAFGFFCSPPLVIPIGSKITISYEGEYPYQSQMRSIATPIADRSSYADDETYANFFEVVGGSIGHGKLYRSYSTVLDTYTDGRSYYANMMAEKYGVNFVMMLASKGDLGKLPEWTKGTYVSDLMYEGKAFYADLEPGETLSNYKDLRTVIDNILTAPNPCLIHCDIGKDRTGVICTLLLGTCGASNQEMEDCYMQAYVNLYGLEKNTDTYRIITDQTYSRVCYILQNPDLINSLYMVDWSKVSSPETDMSHTVVEFMKSKLGYTDSDLEKIRAKLA